MTQAKRKTLRQILRLVVQTRKTTWGSEGLEIVNRHYVLQAQAENGAWHTIPMVDFNRLPAEEQEAIRSEVIE